MQYNGHRWAASNICGLIRSLSLPGSKTNFSTPEATGVHDHHSPGHMPISGTGHVEADGMSPNQGDQAGAPQNCVQPPLLWSTLPLITAHLFGAAVLTLASLTNRLMAPCVQ